MKALTTDLHDFEKLRNSLISGNSFCIWFLPLNSTLINILFIYKISSNSSSPRISDPTLYVPQKSHTQISFQTSKKNPLPFKCLINLEATQLRISVDFFILRKPIWRFGEFIAIYNFEASESQWLLCVWDLLFLLDVPLFSFHVLWC